MAWGGPARERPLGSGVSELSRPIDGVLEAGAATGPRNDLVSLVQQGEVRLRYPLHWEVSSALKASPGGVVVPATTETHSARVLVRSLDGRAFQVVKADASLPGVRAETGTKASREHLIRLDVEPRPELRGRSGEVTIVTDHPLQQEVRVSLFVQGEGRAPAAPGGGR